MLNYTTIDPSNASRRLSNYAPFPFLSLAVPVLSLVFTVLSLAVPVLPLAVPLLSLAAPLLGAKLQMPGIKGGLLLINMATMTSKMIRQ